MLHKLALNALGVCCVPVNPDYRPRELTYYKDKAPGWLWFAESIPTTGTQKIQKHRVFPSDTDPRTLDGIDLRALKKCGQG